MVTTRKKLAGSTAIRHANFLNLLEQFQQERLQKFPDAQERGVLKEFGEFVGVSDRYLSHVKCKRKPMGPKIARAIEAAFDKPEGWLDKEQGGSIEVANAVEREALEMYQALLRSEPEVAREMVMDYVKVKLAQAGRAHQKADAPTAKAAKRKPRKELSA